MLFPILNVLLSSQVSCFAVLLYALMAASFSASSSDRPPWHHALQDCIVHTYAACCVERFLTVKDGAAPRVGRLELQPMLQPFMTNLFACLALESSKENPHIMK